MGKIFERKLVMMNSLRIFCGSFSVNPSPAILNTHNIKETSSKSNIWGPFYTPKGGGSGGG